MWLLFVEAGIAVFLLIFIVWWTMFAGRKPPREETREDPSERQTDEKQD